jgi:DNA polymerase-3 subunit gamma/tau
LGRPFRLKHSFRTRFPPWPELKAANAGQPMSINSPPNSSDAAVVPGAAAAKGDGPAPYLVLARKYRPSSFDDLIGQDAMVRTLKNAFRLGRIAQAYMLTGVRGVGKTTTARILARALNYSRRSPGGSVGDHGPSIDMPELGEHCQQIIESRHVDVVEMDAASHTGIEDIRELIEQARYKPAYARYKVFIIDEVHMLSKSAFNGLLKTLEEPPEHAKFIFATTEIRKVPVTVLSRCQRFDLRRISVELLTRYYGEIARREGQQIEEEALALIARAAEGSVRDGLSILDQAFAHGQGQVAAADVRGMLGLSSRSRIFDLLEAVFMGDAAQALRGLGGLYEDGGDPEQTLGDLAEAVHAVTRMKAAGVSDPSWSETERSRAAALAAKTSLAALSRAWQMLLKGLEETSRAPRALAAAEMVLIRMCYAATLPPPDALIRTLTNGAVPAGAAPASQGALQAKGESHSGAPPGPSGSSVTVSSAPRPSPQARFTPLDEPPLPSEDSYGARWDDGDASPAYASSGRQDGEPGEAHAAEVAFAHVGSFADAARLAGEKRDVRLKVALEEYVELVRFRPGHIELRLLAGAPAGLANDLGRKLQQWTGERWIVSVSDAPGEKPLGAQRREQEERAREEVKRHPEVKMVFQYFPDAEITAVRDITLSRKQS